MRDAISFILGALIVGTIIYFWPQISEDMPAYKQEAHRMICDSRKH